MVLQATLRALGDAPTRSASGWLRRPRRWLYRPLSHRPRPLHPGWRPYRNPSPPFGHEGTERRIVSSQDPTERTRCDRGKNNCPTVKNVLLIDATLTILFLSDPQAGSVHDKQIADMIPSPLPAGSRLLQALGFLAYTLPRVEVIMPTRKPRGRALMRTQKAANRRMPRRRSRVKRCCSVHDTSRLCKKVLRDLAMAVCCALHNYRVRLIASNRWFDRNEL